MGNSRRGNLILKVAIAIAIILMLTTVANIVNFKPLSLSLGEFGYVTAFQNPKIFFYGVQSGGTQYTPKPDTTLTFNPDGSAGLPQVNGQMTSIFEPKNSIGWSTWPSWNPVPASWTQNLGLYANGWNGQSPEATYNWTIGSDTFCMAQYRMKWYVAFDSTWSPQEDPGTQNGGVAWLLHPNNEIVYSGAKAVDVWFKIDSAPTWYIEGGGTAYLAIGSVRLSQDVQMASKDVNGHTYQARTTEHTNPESMPAQVMLYYNAWGGSAMAEVTPENFNGHSLNPAFFRDSTYLHLTLDNFGVQATATSPVDWQTKGDTATFCFDVTVFVIGDYQVQDIQNDPGHFGYFTPVQSTGGILEWFLSAQTLAWLIPAVIVVLVLIFAPWIIIAILAMLGISRRR